MKTLTFIIPVYNGREHICRCLDSLLAQDYPDLKLIIIDDGSTDDSASYIEAYLSEHPSNISFHIETQDNSGVAASRNRGVSLAASDYVAFIDQDDYIDNNFCSEFMSAVSETDYDMVIGGFCRRDNQGRLLRSMVPTDNEWSKYCLTYPWGRIIRRKFLIDNNIRFLKTSIGEDVYFDLVAYSFTDNIKMLSNCSYVWVDNPASVSNRQYTSINNLTDPLFTFNRILSDCSPESFIPKEYAEYYFLKFCIWYLLFSVRKSRHTDILSMRGRLFAWMNEHYPAFIHNPNISPFRPKGDLKFNRISVWGYMILYRLHLDKAFLWLLSK